jgi:uncharacterized SAM-binding protein YcdF (DUF218 family)
MEVLLIKIIQTLLLPPGLMILLMLAGYFLARRLPRFGKIMLVTGFGLLVLASLPIVADFNLRLLEGDTALSPTKLAQPSAEAIVILCGGRNFQAPEYGTKYTLSRLPLARARYGAFLHRKTQLPVLVTGGNVYTTTTTSEAELMRQALVEDFHVPVKWMETNSRTTWENAVLSKSILDQANINRIYLVTTAMHMPRARMAFEAVGLNVVPAPTDFNGQNGGIPVINDFLPSAKALHNNYYFMHEVLGILWYKLRYTSQ